MSDRATIEARLDGLLQDVAFPVRPETLERVWHLTSSEPSAEILVIVTFRAKPGKIDELEQLGRDFVIASSQLEGGLFSALYRSPEDSLTLTLVERFADQSALDRHMQAAYFQHFQLAHRPLVSRPAEAAVLHRRPVD